MGDEDNAYRECLNASLERREISDACARVIANMFHEGQASVSYSFASTGFISDATTARERKADRDRLWRDMFGRWDDLRGRHVVFGQRMLAYLSGREDRGQMGAVPGWPELWLTGKGNCPGFEPRLGRFSGECRHCRTPRVLHD